MQKQTSLSLQKLQRLFKQRLISEKEPTASILKKLHIKDAKPIPYLKRMDIYRFAYVNRLYNSLKEDFPSLLKKAGKPKFEKLAKTYIRKKPSHFFNLTEFSEAFCEFVPKSLKLLAYTDFYSAEFSRFLDSNKTPFAPEPSSRIKLSSRFSRMIKLSPSLTALFCWDGSELRILNFKSKSEKQFLNLFEKGTTLEKVGRYLEKRPHFQKQATKLLFEFSRLGLLITLNSESQI